jgi:hypothetical protein
MLTFGADNSNQPLQFVIIPAIMNNDNQEAYSLAGLNMKSSHRCHLCEIPQGVINTTVCCFTQDRFRESSQVVHLLHCHQQHFISFLKAPRKARVSAEYTNSTNVICVCI